MKNLIFIPLALIFVGLSSCTKDDNYTGSGNLVSETRTVNVFTKVNSEGVFKINILQGETQSVEVTADDNIIGLVRTEVVNDELKLYLAGDNFNDITLRANITVRQLNGLKNSGIGNILASNINVNGGFSVFNSGTADIDITGSAESLSVINEGTGNFLGFNFMVNAATVNNSGSGSLELNCSETLDAKISGSGNVFYKGDPVVNTSISGSGNVIKVED